jgi:hypothetical protein
MLIAIKKTEARNSTMGGRRHPKSWKRKKEETDIYGF